MARHLHGNLIGRKSLLVLLKLISLPGIVHQSLALLISVLLLSESVAATPERMGIRITQQPAATEQDATRAAAERAYQEGEQLVKQGTAESLRQAIGKFEEALSLYRAVGERVLEVAILNRVGVIYTTLGEAQKALEYYNRALLLIREVGNNHSVEALILYNIGSIYSGSGYKQKALDSFNQAWQLYRAAGDRKLKAAIISDIGQVYFELGENQKALDSYNQALNFYREVEDREGEATTLISIGAVYSRIGENQKALNLYNQLLQLYQAASDRPSIADTFILIGKIYWKWQEWQKALNFFNQALTLYQEVGDRKGEATALVNIGAVYSTIGEKQKALDLYNQALQFYQAVGDRAGAATILNNIASTYDPLREKDKALNYYERALILRRALGDRGGEATTLGNIGFVYYASGEVDKALDYYNQALFFKRALGDKLGIATTLNNIGLVYFSVGKLEKALNYYNQALPLVRELGYRVGESLTLSNIAKVESDRGNLKVALTQMEAAIQIIENLRTKVASQEFRASYFASIQFYYKFYIDLLMQLHKTNPTKGYDALALNASERARARNLLEILTEARADIRRGADPNLVQQERTLQQQLSAQEYRKYQLRQGQYTNKELDDIENDIKSLLGQLNDVQAQLRVKSPSYAALTQPQAFTLNLQQIQQQVLDDNTLLLEYSLGKDRSYLWAVTKTGITSYELPKGVDIEAAAKDFYSQLQSEAASNSEAGMKLSQMLLAPVASQLGQKRLVIVSDGALQSIPFAALPIPSTAGGVEGEVQQGKNTALPTATLTPTSGLTNSSPTSPASPASSTPLLVQHEILSLPSASTLAVLRREVKDRPPAAKTLAVLANPVFNRDDQRFKTAQQPRQNTTVPTADPLRSSPFGEATETYDPLPNTLTEAQQILQFVPNPTQSLQAFGFAASRTTATSPELAQYRMIHFATHGSANGEHPELSKVVLSLVDEKGADINGFLHLQDIFNLNLPAELVVLSACQTGLGKDVKGEGLVGLTRGFMYAGSKRVVVSLWSVKDSSTAELMTNFYQQMLQQGVNPVAALRAAQLKMLQSEQWKAPYYWAPFVIQGEWR